MTSIQDILGSVKISDIYRALTGVEPRRTGSDTWRAPATWRGGDGHNVSLDDSRGVWHDFAADEGGGIIDLVVRVQGGSRHDALQWISVFTGIAIDDSPLSADDRARWAKEKQELKRDLPNAKYWRRAAVALAEETLSVLKAAFFDPTAESQPSSRDLQDVTSLLSRLNAMGDSTLVAEYRSWMFHQPGLTALMVRGAVAREKAERRALIAYLRSGAKKAVAA